MKVVLSGNTNLKLTGLVGGETDLIVSVFAIISVSKKAIFVLDIASLNSDSEQTVNLYVRDQPKPVYLVIAST